MSQLEISRNISAPTDRVWAIITDIEGSPAVISGIDEVERLSDDAGFKVGTRWRETRTLFGKEATEEMEVTAIDEHRSYTVEADSRNVHYTSVFTLQPADDGSSLRMTFEGVPRGAFTKFMAATVGRLMKGPTRKALQRDLDDIAAAAER